MIYLKKHKLDMFFSENYIKRLWHWNDVNMSQSSGLASQRLVIALCRDTSTGHLDRSTPFVDG